MQQSGKSLQTREELYRKYGRGCVDAWLARTEEVLAQQEREHGWVEDGQLTHVGTSFVVSGSAQDEERSVLKVQAPWCLSPEASALLAWPASMTIPPLRHAEEWLVLPWSDLPELTEADLGDQKEVMMSILNSPILRTSAPEGTAAAWPVFFDRAIYWRGRHNPAFQGPETETVFLAACALQRSTVEPLFVHGDLLTKNVLWGGGRWLVVDPIPGVGELSYELAKVSLEFADAVYTERVFAGLWDTGFELTDERVEAWRAFLAFGELSWHESEDNASFCNRSDLRGVFEGGYELLQNYAALSAPGDRERWRVYDAALQLRRAEA